MPCKAATWKASQSISRQGAGLGPPLFLCVAKSVTLSGMNANGQSNGQAKVPEPSVAELKEQVERAELRVRLKAVQATESAFGQTQDFVNPAEPLFDSPDFFYPWYGENLPFNLDNRLRGELLPIYVTEYGLKILRDYSRWLAAYNPWAIQIVENKVSYLCGKGFGYTCAPRDREEGMRAGDRELCRLAQRHIDRFCERVNFGAWEQLCIKKGTVDGEFFLRFFHLGRGEVTVRPVEPEHVRSPGDQSAHRSFGVETPEFDILDVKGYWVIEKPSVWWEPSFVEAAHVLHVKENVGPTAKRGYPFLIPIRKNLIRADRLLQIMSVLASAQSSIAGIRKWKQYSASDVSAFQQNNADVQFTDPVSGQPRYVKRYLPGTWLDAPENVDYELPGTKINAGALVEVLQAELRAIASRANWPEYMVGADASNANYASTAVAEAPGVKQLEREQAGYARAFGDGIYAGSSQCGALWKVLEYGVRWGGLPRAILRRVKLQAEGPSLVARDKDKETTRAATLNEKGVLSKRTWSKWEGLDRAEEREAIEREGPAVSAAPKLGPDGKPLSPQPGGRPPFGKPAAADKAEGDGAAVANNPLYQPGRQDFAERVRRLLRECRRPFAEAGFDPAKHPRADDGKFGAGSGGGGGGAAAKVADGSDAYKKAADHAYRLSLGVVRYDDAGRPEVPPAAAIKAALAARRQEFADWDAALVAMDAGPKARAFVAKVVADARRAVAAKFRSVVPALRRANDPGLRPAAAHAARKAFLRDLDRLSAHAGRWNDRVADAISRAEATRRRPSAR